MPMVNVTDSILNEEKKEMDKIIKSNQKAKEAYELFGAECKLRRELATARKLQKMNQTELQARTGLSQQAISRIETENNISPSLKNLIKYVDAIGYEITIQPKECTNGESMERNKV